MACPLCGERCTCSYTPGGTRVSAASDLTYEYEDGVSEDGVGVSPVPSDTEGGDSELETVAADDRRPTAPPEDIALESEPPPSADTMWKQEIASRLESYRARRGTRRPRYNGTLSLDFDRAANRMMALAEDPEPEDQFFGAAAMAAAEDVAEPETELPAAEETYAEPVARIAAPKAPEPKIIEFPRLPTLFDNPPTGAELAEPVIDKPRILLVPEEVPTSVAPLADIQLDPEEPAAVDELDLPLCVAPMGQRFLAGCADALIVMIASFVFLGIVLRHVPAPDGRLGYALVALLPVTLWSIYEYLFLVHCATTPGMQLAGLSLASFGAEIIRRRTRRARALACMLSTFPLALGLIWALLDDDTLCWHDRISRTYLVHAESNE